MKIFALFSREIKQIFSDPWLLSMMSWIPLALFFLMWLIFSKGVATDIPIGVVDQDNSKASRELIRKFDASPEMAVTRNYIDLQQAEKSLRLGTVYGLIVIPDNFEKNIIKGRPPQVTAFINSQFLLMGRVLKSAILKAQSTFAVQIDTAKNLTGPTPVFSMALSAAMPIGNQTTALFNHNRDYAQFLLAAIFPAIWQIIIVITSVLSLTREQRVYGLANWLGKTPCRKILIKILTLTFFFFLQGALFLTAMYIILRWPMHGKWSILFSAQLLTIPAAISAAFLIFFLIRDPSRSLSISASYAAPALAFMGVTFPATDMTLPARIWRSLLPISHYIDIQIGQVNYGVPLKNALPHFAALTCFIIPAMLVILLAIKTASREPEKAEAIS